MGMITIAEVLERVNDFERMLAEFYAKWPSSCNCVPVGGIAVNANKLKSSAL